MVEPSQDFSLAKFIRFDEAYLLRLIYSKKLISTLFCFVFLVTRHGIFDLYYAGNLNKTFYGINAAIDMYLLSAVFYGFICTWVFKKTYLDSPNPIYFFLSSGLLAIIFFVGYLQFVTGAGSTTVYQWRVVFLLNSKIQLPFLIWILINPFNFMMILSGIVFLQSQISRPQKSKE